MLRSLLTGETAISTKCSSTETDERFNVVNPWRACAVRVTVLGSVCLFVCLAVRSHLTSRMSNRAINEHAYLVAYECQKICENFPETIAFKSYATKHE